MAGWLKYMLKNLHFYAIKLPFYYFLMVTGFIFEFLTTFPFAIMVSIDAYRRKNR